MSNTSPNSLVRKPKLHIAKYGKKPLYVAVAGLFVLAIVLILSVQLSTKSNQVEEVGQAVSVRENDTLTVHPVEAPEGLAQEQEKKPLDLEQNEESRITVVRPEEPSEEYLAKKREWEQIRQMKRQAELKALSSPMRIAVPAGRTSAAPAQVRPSPQGASGRGFETATMPQQVVPASASPGGYDQTERVDKEGFYERAERQKWELPQRRVAGAPYELKTGWVIPGMMISGIQSDLPGEISGQVSLDVYDTATGNYLLIPRGSRLKGLYDSRIANGQERILVAWNRIVFPDGSSITLGAMPGADGAGLSGFKGEVDNHYGRVFGQSVLMSLISGGAAYAMDQTTSAGSGSDDNPSVLDSFGGALASQLNQSTSNLLQRNISLKPSLGIETGYRFNIIVTKDIVFKAPYTPWR